MSLLPTNGCVGSSVLQSIVESVLSIYTWSLLVHARNGIVGYQIDTTGMPPMNLSLSDLDEITERIGFSSPRNQHQLQFSLPVPSSGSSNPVVPGDVVRFVFAVQSGNLIVTKTLRVDITL